MRQQNERGKLQGQVFCRIGVLAGLQERWVKMLLYLLVILLAMSFWSACGAASEDFQHLFVIERSKNRNIVRYDARTTRDGDLAGEAPVIIYWVLENGETSDLSHVQKKYAYGIESQERLEHNRYEIVLTAFTERKLTVKKTDNGYKAFVLINGKETVLERIYVESREGFAGLPKVLYVDLFGRDGQTALPVTERIFR